LKFFLEEEDSSLEEEEDESLEEEDAFLSSSLELCVLLFNGMRAAPLQLGVGS
jgi:hypothetical protein